MNWITKTDHIEVKANARSGFLMKKKSSFIVLLLIITLLLAPGCSRLNIDNDTSNNKYASKEDNDKEDKKAESEDKKSESKDKESGTDTGKFENKGEEYSTEYGAEYSGPLDGHDELIWDEKAMFGLKQPNGVIRDHFVDLTGNCYILEEMSQDEIYATIQAIKDLGFTLDAFENDGGYSAYHEKYTNRKLSLKLYYIKKRKNPEVWIDSYQ